MEFGFHRTSTPKMILGLVVIFALAVTAGPTHAQKAKEMEGLRFQVPEDWPIEKRGGVLGPIPTEEYVALKFEKVNQELEAVKTEMSGQFSEIKADLESLRTELSKDIQNAAANAAVLGASGGADMSGMLARLEEAESQLGRLDRKLTNKLMDISREFEGINLQIKALEESLKSLHTQVIKLDEEVGYIAEKQQGGY